MLPPYPHHHRDSPVELSSLWDCVVAGRAGEAEQTSDSTPGSSSFRCMGRRHKDGMGKENGSVDTVIWHGA